jgi:hypothetical protein
MKKILLSGMAVLLTACSLVEAKPVAPISKEVRAVCMGRHQMELPKDFEQAMGSSSIFTPPGLTDAGAPIDVVVKAAGMGPAEFQRQVELRRGALLAAGRKATNVLKEVVQVSKEAVIFRVMEIDDAYNDELHLLRDGVYIVASTDSYENSYVKAEARLVEFAGHVEKAGDGANAAKGFCLGPVVVNGRYAGEYGKLSFRSKAAPEVQVSVVVDTYTPDESKSLLQRVSGGDSLLTRMGVHPKVLRKGELQVAGMNAQEWLAWIQPEEDSARKQYSFALETRRPAPGPLQPSLHLEFDAGRRGESGLTQEQAVALWDSVSRSIRPRAGN